jgi:hypothetical protein
MNRHAHTNTHTHTQTMAHTFEPSLERDVAYIDEECAVPIYRCGSCGRIQHNRYFATEGVCISVPGQKPCQARICDACLSSTCYRCGHEIKQEDEEWMCEVCMHCSCAPASRCRECQIHRRYQDILYRLRSERAAAPQQKKKKQKVAAVQEGEASDACPDPCSP